MPGGNYPPPEAIATWPKPNYVDPELRSSAVSIMSIVLAILAIIVFAGRIYSRVVMTRNAGVDDWLMSAAMFFAIAMTIGIILAVEQYGFRRHVWDVPLPTLMDAIKITWANMLLYVAATGLVKLSILSFYHRLTAGAIGRWFNVTLAATAASVIIYMLVFLIVPFATASPFAAWWLSIDPVWRATHSYRLSDEGVDILVASVISVIQDFVVAALPTVMFLRMSIPFRQKVALGAVFTLGFFLCIAGSLRIYYAVVVFWQTYDVTWAAYPLWAWCVVETLVGTMVASAPALKVFFRAWLQTGSLGSSHKTSTARATATAAHVSVQRQSRSLAENVSSYKSIADVTVDPLEKPWLADPTPLSSAANSRPVSRNPSEASEGLYDLELGVMQHTNSDGHAHRSGDGRGLTATSLSVESYGRPSHSPL